MLVIRRRKSKWIVADTRKTNRIKKSKRMKSPMDFVMVRLSCRSTKKPWTTWSIRVKSVSQSLPSPMQTWFVIIAWNCIPRKAHLCLLQMRRSLYLGDTVYEVIAEAGFEVRRELRSESLSDCLNSRKKHKLLPVSFKRCTTPTPWPLYANASVNEARRS